MNSLVVERVESSNLSKSRLWQRLVTNRTPSYSLILHFPNVSHSFPAESNRTYQNKGDKGKKANPVVRAASKRPVPEICSTSSADTNKTMETTPVTNKRVLSLVHLSFKADVAPAVSKSRVSCSER